MLRCGAAEAGQMLSRVFSAHRLKEGTSVDHGCRHAARILRSPECRFM